MDDYHYAGFWVRAIAAVIDTLLLMAVLVPVIMIFFGSDALGAADPDSGIGMMLINYLLPAVVVIVFWVYRSATPGKIILGLHIIDEKTGGKPSTGQFIGRYLCYYVSIIPLFLGILWVAFDKRKQGWHDKLAGTYVVKR